MDGESLVGGRSPVGKSSSVYFVVVVVIEKISIAVRDGTYREGKLVRVRIQPL